MNLIAFGKIAFCKKLLSARFLFIMRITTLLLFITFMQVSGNSLAQKISLHAKQTSLKEVVEKIKKQSGYHVVYIKGLMDHAKPIDVDLNQVTITEALQKVFRDQSLTYEIKEKTIVIKPTERNVMRLAAQVVVKGTVADTSGLPLPGVSVILKNKTSTGTSTDANGNYIIAVPDDATLVFSYAGYKKMEVAVDGRDRIDVVLQSDISNLEEVVVIGYGEQKKSSVVSSMSTITPEKISFPTRNLTNNLSGQLAGLMSIQRTGEPGRDDAEFWIRGISTFAGGTTNSPLVLVDGVPRAINNIEPDEIETFTVLKDAAATAVYGAEGANGVILVTTKRGTLSKPYVSFRTEHSFSKPTRLPEFVDSWQYLELTNEALTNDGFDPIFSTDLIGKYRNREDDDLYPNAKWLDELLNEVNTNQRYTLNFRGGTEKARYFVSGAYFKENGIFNDDPLDRYQTNIGLKRYNLRSNIDIDITESTLLNVDLSGQYLQRNSPGVDAPDIFSLMLNTPSYIFPAVYSDGTLATYPIESDGNNRNPYNQLMNSGYKKEWNALLQSGVGLTQKLNFITEGLHVNGKVSFDYDGTFSSTRSYNPGRFYATGRDENGQLIFSQSVSGNPDMGAPVAKNSAAKKIYLESSIHYNRSFAKHVFGGMLLYMQKENQLYDNALAFRKQGVVGRATYSYGNRYFLEGNFGYTGSETFAKGQRFGFFPAVGLGYIVTNEPFFPKGLKKYITSVKFRASAGRTGNDNTGTARFLYRPTYNMGGSGFNQGITSGGGSNGLGDGITDLQFENPSLVWEIEDKFNLGMDLNLLENRVEIVADYFRSKRNGILLQRRTIPGSAGFWEAPWDNYGAVENWGFDGSLNARHTWGDFKLGLRGTFTFARNKIIEYDELPQPYPWMALTGTRVNENTLYIAERLYTDNDFIITPNANGTNAYQLKPELPSVALQNNLGPGDIKFKDLNGDGVIDQFDKKRGNGHPYQPEIIFGFGINVDYKGFYVSAFLQGTGNTSVLLGNGNSTFFPFNWGYDKSNYRSFMLDRWSPDNPSQDVTMPRLHNRYEQNVNKEPSTWWLRSGSFLRFKNLELGYNAPEAFAKRIKAQNLRVYVMGYNLAVWDSIKYWDPETGNDNAGMSYPLPRTLCLGLDVTF